MEKRFAEPVATETVISATLSRLAEMLVAVMERQGKGARRLEASFFRTDGAVRTIAVETGQPVTKAEVVDRLFRERLGAFSRSARSRFRLRSDPAVRQPHAKSSCRSSAISTPMSHDNDELAALIDRIAARIGGRRVVVHLPQDTHIPERAAMAVPAQHHLAALRVRYGRRAPKGSRRCGRCGCSNGRSRSW